MERLSYLSYNSLTFENLNFSLTKLKTYKSELNRTIL